jgi:hypothetical protein
VGGSDRGFAGDADAQSLTVTGSGVADTFHIRPDQDPADILTPISVLGLAPLVAPGDVLNLDATGLGIPTLLVGPGPNAGQYTFGALAASVTYSSIETVNTDGGAVNLIIDTKYLGFQNGAADTIFVRLDTPPSTNLLVDVNGIPSLHGAAAGINR